MKDFADNHFRLDENGSKFSKREENTVGKRRNCSLRAISLFPTVFSKDLYCRRLNIQSLIEKRSTHYQRAKFQTGPN